jgi:hypothetical protein
MTKMSLRSLLGKQQAALSKVDNAVNSGMRQELDDLKEEISIFRNEIIPLLDQQQLKRLLQNERIAKLGQDKPTSKPVVDTEFATGFGMLERQNNSVAMACNPFNGTPFIFFDASNIRKSVKHRNFDRYGHLLKKMDAEQRGYFSLLRNLNGKPIVHERGGTAARWLCGRRFNDNCNQLKSPYQHGDLHAVPTVGQAKEKTRANGLPKPLGINDSLPEKAVAKSVQNTPTVGLLERAGIITSAPVNQPTSKQGKWWHNRQANLGTQEEYECAVGARKWLNSHSVESEGSFDWPYIDVVRLAYQDMVTSGKMEPEECEAWMIQGYNDYRANHPLS